MASADERSEEVIADVASGLFDGFAGLSGALGDVGAVKMQGNIEAGTEIFDELLIGIGFSGADAVVDVGGAEADAERVVLCDVGRVEGAQECYRVCAAGDSDADAVAGFNVGAVEGECGWARHKSLW